MMTTSVSWCAAMLLLFAELQTTALAASRLNNIAGPYRLIPDNAERCPVSEGGVGVGKLYKDRNNQDKWYYWANLTLLENFDDSYDGYYEIKNISTEFLFKKVPVFFYGTWRITTRVIKGQTPKACFWLFGKTVPK